jgi:deoxyribodipyrimidine photo-lyase
LSGPATAIVWFRRDLRLTDNPALSAACRRAERVVALYVHAPPEESTWAPGAASRWWLQHSLAALAAALESRGGRLCLRVGASLETLFDVARATQASAVYWNRLYEPDLLERDARVEAALRGTGIACESFGTALLHEPWQLLRRDDRPFRVFSAYWRSCMPGLEDAGAPLPAPARIAAPDPPPTSLDLAELGLMPRVRWDAGLATAWRPGEDTALARLDAFTTTAMATYGGDRDRPDLASTSRLSPHLHFGEVSARQCLAAVRNAVVERPAERVAADAFLRQLGWREFAHHLLYHFPHTTTEPLDARFAHFRWDPSQAWTDAWRGGRTGIPLVDAGMRELWSTGWMHNRLRMVVASFLTKNLRQPWLDGARWFWDTLVDADLANNTLGWQWTAGCGADAAPYFRVFNPVLQAERFDPRRTYLRRWLPELADLPDRWIHRPWEAPSAVLAAAGVELGRHYPKPIVDLKASRVAALAAYAGIGRPRPPNAG